MSIESTTNELREAIEQVRLFPHDLRVKQRLAELYEQAGELERAALIFEQVAEAYFDRQQVQKAVTVYKLLLKHRPTRLSAQQRLAELYTALEWDEEAIAQWQKLAALAEQEGDQALAIEALEQLERRRPLTIPTQVKLAALCVSQARLGDALKRYERALEQLEEKSQWGDYQKVAEQLLTFAPTHLATRKMLAKLYMEQGRPEDALNQLKLSLNIAPRDPEILELLAMAFDALEQPERGTAMLKELANIYEERGDIARAQLVYIHILERDPSSKVALHALEHLQVVSSLHPLDSYSSHTDLNSLIDSYEAFPPEELSQTSRESLTVGRELHELQSSEISPEQLEYLLNGTNVSPEQLSPAQLQAILSRPAHPGLPPAPWPGHLRAKLDGELLYEERYLITDQLGEGPSGKTYRAIDLSMPTQFVCIKRPHFLDLNTAQEERYLTLFIEYAERLHERSHPNLIRVISSGITAQRYPYLITEYFPSVALSALKPDLSPKQIAHIFYHLAHTISYLHSIGTMHGALSPRNLLINRNGEPKLNDAGLAQLLSQIGAEVGFDVFSQRPNQDAEVVLLGPQKLRGIRGFVAPELVAGAPPSSLSEIFQLGCLLYYLVAQSPPPWSGKHTLNGISYQGLTRTETEAPPQLPIQEAAYKDFLQSLFDRMVAYQPKDRLSLRDLQQAYLSFLQEREAPEGFQVEETIAGYNRSPVLSTMRHNQLKESDSTLDLVEEEHQPFHRASPNHSSTPQVQLPEACQTLPQPLQQQLQMRLQQMRKHDWFNGHGDPQKGLALLCEHIQRLQPFAASPWKPKLAYVRASWQALEAQIPTQEEINKIVERAADQTLRACPEDHDRAGHVAWSALDQYIFSNKLLLPFDMANAALSAIGWSVSHVSDWAIASAAAKAASKAAAVQANRLNAWNAIKSAAWRIIWPFAKAASAKVGSSLAQTAAWPLSWDASWHAAWTSISDLPGTQEDPFAPLFAIWESGLYPLLLHNNDYLLFIPTPHQKTHGPFKVIHANY